MNSALAASLPEEPALAEIWAKSAVPPSAVGESLAEHTAAVLCRLAELMRLRPDLPGKLGEPRLWHRLYWAAFLHDWGKAARGFQAQVRSDTPWGRRHEVLSLAFLSYVAPMGGEDWRWLAAAVASHHRDKDVLQKCHDPAGSAVHQESIRELVAEIDAAPLAALWRWLQDCGQPWAQTLGFVVKPPAALPGVPENVEQFRARAAGEIGAALQSYYDWVDGLADRFCDDPLALGPLVQRGLLITADHAGSAHRGGFRPVPVRAPAEMLGAWEACWRQPAHRHQQECAATHGSVMLVAPTGAGKTEAAQLWAARQAEAGGQPVPRLFYLLPYQASMNAMHRRLSALYGEAAVGLQHGRARHALYRRYLDREQSPRRAAREAALAGNLARLHLPPVRVLSPYQLLKACYRLRGYEAVLADLSGALMICDEIHAYDVRRLALILSMLGLLHRDFGVRFCCMSATFPGLLVRWLDEVAPDLRQIRASPETEAAFRRHSVRVCDGDLLDPESLRQIAAAAGSGRSVLVCCNTVTRAQRACAALRALGLSPELLHGRFNARDRNTKERLLQERMGTAVPSADRHVVMVATQVVEVSLDIDFDCLFTDLAPLDALLQRFGRINRGRRRAAEETEVVVFTQPLEPDRPYAAALLEGALRVLRREFGPAGAILHEDRVSEWLNEVYSGDLEAQWEREYRAARQEFEEAILGTLYPFQSEEHLERQFYETFDSVEVLPVSLLGEWLALQEDQPLAASELLVPIRWRHLAALRSHGAVSDGPEQRLFVVERPYSYDQGLELWPPAPRA